MKTIKCYYRRDLKMSSEKLAAQVGHVIGNLSRNTLADEISVNAVGNDKFAELKNTPRCHVQWCDGCEAVLGFWEREE